MGRDVCTSAGVGAGDAESGEAGRSGGARPGRCGGEEAQEGSDPAPGGGDEDLARGPEPVAGVGEEAAAGPRRDLDAQPGPSGGGRAGAGRVPFVCGDALGEAVDEPRCAVRGDREADPAEGVAHHGEPGLGARFAAVQREVHVDGELLGGQPLDQDVGQQPQVVLVRGPYAGEPQPVPVVPGGPAGSRVGRPLPLCAGPAAGEVVVDGGCRHRLGGGDGFGVPGDGFAPVADDGPALGVPAHRLEVDDPPVRSPGLEVEEPVLALGGVHPAALMGAVDVGAALGEDDAFLVRAEEVPGTEGALPAGLHAAGRREDPEVAVAPVELGAFEGEPARYPVGVHQRRSVVEEAAAVGAHPVAGEPVLHAGAGLGPRVDEIGLAGLLVPERTGVDEPLARLEQMRGAPRSLDAVRVDLLDTVVGVAPEDPEASAVVAERRRPDPAVVAGSGEVVSGFETVQRMSDGGPVDQVAGVQERQPGERPKLDAVR